MDTPNGGDDSPRSISSTRQPHMLVAEDAMRAQSAEAEQLADRTAAAKTAVETVAAQAAVDTSFAEFEDLPQRSEDTPRRRMTARKNVAGQQNFSSDDSWIGIDSPSQLAAAAALAAHTGAKKQAETQLGSEFSTMLALLLQQQMAEIAELRQELKASKTQDEAWWSEPGTPVQTAGEATVPGPALREFVPGADLNFSFDEQKVATKEAAPRIKEIPELPKLTVPKSHGILSVAERGEGQAGPGDSECGRLHGAAVR